MTLPAYNSVKQCEKCGYGENRYSDPSRPPFPARYIPGNIWLADRLARTCPRCGYTWDEAVAEKEKG